MYVLRLYCDQGIAYAWFDAGCTDIANARRFEGWVSASRWLLDHVAYLDAIGLKAFELVKA